MKALQSTKRELKGKRINLNDVGDGKG